MDVEQNDTIISIICSQTGVEDIEVVKRSLQKHDGDIVKCIMELSYIQEATPRNMKLSTNTIEFDEHMDNMRMIVEAKEKLFHDFLSKSRES